jgi:hypothetical protein
MLAFTLQSRSRSVWLGRGSLIAWCRTAVRGSFMRHSDGGGVVSREGLKISEQHNCHNRDNFPAGAVRSSRRLTAADEPEVITSSGCAALRHADSGQSPHKVTDQSPIFPIAIDELGCLYAWENNPKQPNPGLRFKGGVKRSWLSRRPRHAMKLGKRLRLLCLRLCAK